MIDCHKCEHFYITWDKHFPYGCKAMNFKSKYIPSVTVFSSSHIECLLFEKKKRKIIPQKAGQARDKKSIKKS